MLCFNSANSPSSQCIKIKLHTSAVQGTNAGTLMRSALCFQPPAGPASQPGPHRPPLTSPRSLCGEAGKGCVYLEGSVEHLLSASVPQQVYDHLLPILLLQKDHVPATEQVAP